MGNYELKTTNGSNMYDISSMLQKALRRGLLVDASYSANELKGRFRNYMWKRLLTMSAEDCHDFMTKSVLSLMQKDDLAPADENIENAVGMLAYARKNRDSDYFACNLLNSRDRKELHSIEPTVTESCKRQYPTKNGHSMFDVSASLVDSVFECNYEMAGYCANELMVRYRSYLWKTIFQICKRINENGTLLGEISALKTVDESQAGSVNDSSIFVAKAVVSLIKSVKFGTSLMNRFNAYQTIPLKQFDGKFRQIPDYVYDCHTLKGKMKGKTKEMFVVEEQNALKPLFECEFDKSPWDRFFELSKIGFFDKDNITPRPPKEKLKSLDNGVVQFELFG